MRDEPIPGREGPAPFVGWVRYPGGDWQRICEGFDSTAVWFGLVGSTQPETKVLPRGETPKD